jgi:RNA polymerase sigma-70 factor (ECF subfamily)
MRGDEELMLAVAKGDLEAFEQIVLRHQKNAWSAAYRFLGNHMEAEDVAQEAFLKILCAAPRYRPTASFRTYLYRVVTRQCLDRARKARPVVANDLPDSVTDSPSILNEMIGRDRAHAVRRALDSLPPRQRMAIVLRYYEGLAYREIASAMLLSQKAVERLLARARNTLETLLKDLLPE